MATKKQVEAAKRNVKKAQSGAKRKRSIANMPAKTRTALGKQGAAVAKRKRSGGSSPKTRQELYEMAKQRVTEQNAPVQKPADTQSAASAPDREQRDDGSGATPAAAGTTPDTAAAGVRDSTA